MIGENETVLYQLVSMVRDRATVLSFSEYPQALIVSRDVLDGRAADGVRYLVRRVAVGTRPLNILTEEVDMDDDEAVVVNFFRCPVCGQWVDELARSVHYGRHVEAGEMARRRDPVTGELTWLYQAALLVDVGGEHGR